MWEVGIVGKGRKGVVLGFNKAVEWGLIVLKNWEGKILRVRGRMKEG